MFGMRMGNALRDAIKSRKSATPIQRAASTAIKKAAAPAARVQQKATPTAPVDTSRAIPSAKYKERAAAQDRQIARDKKLAYGGRQKKVQKLMRKSFP